MATQNRTYPADRELIASCGLYCGTCRNFNKGKCSGCRSAENLFGWCKKCPVNACRIEHEYHSCADCEEYDDPRQCKKLNNFIGKVFALVFRSDRFGCLNRIREVGGDQFAAEMAEQGNYNRPVGRK